MSVQYPTSRHLPPRQRGYTLIEILVALFIGIFLLVGLFTILQNTRRTSSNQTGLTQLQDEQRMAMSLLTDVIQNAGYFDPNTITSAVALPALAATGLATGQALIASQGLSGSDAAAPIGDMILVRYATNGSTSTTPDGIENCNGGTNGTALTYINTFYISSNALYCSIDGTNTTGIPLVTGVHDMQIYYGVATTTGTNNVDTYMTATQVQASTAGWASVSSVRVTLTFLNPLWGQAGYSATANQYVYFTRVIPIQGRTGVIATAL